MDNTPALCGQAKRKVRNGKEAKARVRAGLPVPGEQTLGVKKPFTTRLTRSLQVFPRGSKQTGHQWELDSEVLFMPALNSISCGSNWIPRFISCCILKERWGQTSRLMPLILAPGDGAQASRSEFFICLVYIVSCRPTRATQ